MEVLDSQRVDNENRMKANSGNNKEIPARVPGWLKEVEDIKKEVEKIPSNNIGCFNVKKKYLAGRNALRLTDDIEGLIKESSDIIWSDAQIPLGRVDPKRPASTSTSTSTSGGNTQNLFDSRVKIFNDALKLLQQNDDDAAQVIAFCGMGGVGKTMLMKKLITAAHDNKMFNWIVFVTIGKSYSLFEIQNVIAAHTGESLTETNETLRATLLSKRFQAFSERKEKSLVILDDVWEMIKLEDIGLASPLPNGVKLLLTSRNVRVCQQIADDRALKEVKVDVMKENEAQDFFCQAAEISAEHDRDLYEIGCEIVNKCGCLPYAIKVIAATVKRKDRGVWKFALNRLKTNDLEKNVREIIEISYDNLEQEKDKAIFLLCGLFPEDSNIPIEDLTRYAWGLKLLTQVSTLEKARNSTLASVSSLKDACLLMDGDSDDYECVKMHDIALAFVVGTVSKGGCWIIHHEDDFSNWSEATGMSQSCKQISLACKGMSEFPIDFKFPNLTFLKLMQGDESLRFPQDFYVGMEKLQVIAFERMEYPVVPTSFQCSTNLRTLCLHECSLMFDLACIGNLLNLEVLSFANSGITILPSTFGNLKELRLLDVTGCYNLAIDDGVLGSLVKLEELYMIPYDEKACCFTDNNNSELAERSKNLCALEFEFFGNNAHMKNMSYEKLERFKLSVGCYFSEVRDKLGRNKVDAHSYQNSLKLITNKEELLKSKISELFMNTDALYLKVNDMNTLEDVDVESPHPPHPRRYSSFGILRLLVVSECTELKYLFTPSVAKNLSKLEYLDISGCPIMEGVIHTENDGSDAIKFSNLKYLRLAKLPKLLHFCNNVDVVELPRLMELQLEGLPKITSIYWSSDISRMQSLFNKEDATPKLEKLVLVDMKNLKEIWPPQFCISNLCPLRELTVKRCGSIEVLFNMDFGEIEKLSSSLRSIEVKRCDSLVKLFSCNPFPFLNNIQELNIESCGSIQVLFNTDLGHVGKSEEQVCSSSLRSIKVKRCDSLVKLFSCNPFPFLNNIQELNIESCGSIQVLFNTDLGHVGKSEEQVCSSSLRSIKVKRCDSLVKLFSCNPFPFLNNLQELNVESCGSIQVLFNTDLGRAGKSEEQVCSSSLRSIRVERCDSLVKLFSCNPFPFLNNLQELNVESCGSIQVLFNTDLGRAGKSEEQVCSSSLRSIRVERCDSLVKLFSCNPFPFLNNLQELNVESCGSIQVLFNTDLGRAGKSEEQVCSSSLRSIRVERCDSLVKLFSCNPFPFLNNLQELNVESCGSIQVLFNTDLGRAGKSEEQVCSSSLRSIRVERCDSLVKLFSCNPFPFLNNLQELNVESCGSIQVLFNTDLGRADKSEEQVCSSSLRSIRVERCDSLVKLFSCNPFPFLNNLQELNVESCGSIQVLFNTDLGRADKSEEQVCSSSLRSIRVERCDSLVKLFSCNPFPFLNNLQELNVESCGSIQVLFNTDLGRADKSEEQVCSSSLRSIRVERCDSLVKLFSCNPFPFLNNLQELNVESCGSIQVLFNTDLGHVGKSEEQVCSSSLRSIKVKRCDSLVKLFSCNPFPFLNNLQELNVESCGSIQVLFNTDLGRAGKSEEQVCSSSLRSIRVERCDSLVKLFSCNPFPFLNNLQELNVESCGSIQVLFNTDLGHVGKSEEQVCSSSLRSIKVKRCDSLVKLFSCNPFPFLNNLQELNVESCGSIQVLFNTDLGRAGKSEEQVCSSSLRSIRVERCDSLVKLFSCNPFPFLNNLQELNVESCGSIQVLFNTDLGRAGKSEEQVCSSSLRSIRVERCDSLVKLFSCNPFPFLNNLQELNVESCGSIQVLFNTDLGRAGKSEEQVCSSSLRSIRVERCDSLVKLFSCNPFPFLNNLQELNVESCGSIQVLFNTDLGRAGKSEEQVCSSSLRSIRVERCDSLVKLFSCNPFPFLNNLQELNVESCGSIQVLFNTDLGRAGKSEEQVCSSSLRSIRVERCDSLVKLFSCNPFPFLNNLQELNVESCGSIQVLFNTDLGRADKSEEQVCSSSLRSIRVSRCDSLVNLLPSNPMPLFNHLEELEVTECASIEVIFDIDMGCVGKMDKVSSSRLRSIYLWRLGKLREVWRIKDAGNNLIHGFEAVESIRIENCERFENLITPATTTFDMRALKKVKIIRCGGESERNTELVENNVIPTSREEVNDGISKVALPSYLLPTFHHLHELLLRDYKNVEVVFEITTPSSRESPQQPPILPYLEELDLRYMGRMSHVWKCDWNEFLILQKPQSQSSFHNLTTITMYKCNSIKYLFSPLMAKLLSSLKKVDIWSCDGIEEVVSNRDDEDASIYSHTTITFFPHLDLLQLTKLRSFKCIGGGANGIPTDIHDHLKLSQAYWSLCQYAREISIGDCDALSSVVPWYAVGQMQKLQVLKIWDCKSMTEVFETQEINKSGTNTGKSLPRLEYITMLKLPKLKILKIQGCDLLKHVFTFSTLVSLAELEELEIKDCEAMEVIVTEENEEQKMASDVVVSHNLKLIALVNLPNIVGFFLGKNEFRWPALEKVVIGECPQITVFASGWSTTPKLNFINTSLGKHSVECGLNFRVTTTSHQARLPSY